MSEKNYIAVDLGAESGRVMLGVVGPERLSLREVYRFGNGPLPGAGPLRWDFDRLISEVKRGIAKLLSEKPGPIAGIGVDSWGVDYGLLDENGCLIEDPYHYRDERCVGMMEAAFEKMDRRQVYENSGLQFMRINTIYQLLAHKLKSPEMLSQARSLVFMADLISYSLCEKIYAEYTLASTSQLMDMHTGSWSRAIFAKLGLPLAIMPAVVKPGTRVGTLSPLLRKDFNCPAIDIIAVGSHDTADAVAAVPARGQNWAYLSSGTWSLMGVETPAAVINDKTYEYNFTNEGGVAGTIRLLKNIMGLWVVQECKRQWERDGENLSYAELTAAAQQARPFAALIDPDHAEFISPGGMPDKINNFLAQKGQPRIADKGQLIRVVLESLALKYRMVIQQLEEVSGMRIETLHVVGGGIKNELLCQFTADATGKRVVAGPVEATACGNIIMQAIATGQIKDLAAGRAIVANSYPLQEYQPRETAAWQRQYDKFVKLIS